jgi:signal peptidase I
MSETKDNTQKQRPSLLSDLLFLLLKIGIIALFVVIIFTFFFGIVQVRDNAMDPAVKDGDLVIYYRLDKNYVASDLAVLEKQGKTQVRRVVGIDGDKIDINRENGLEINGYPQQEDNIYTETLPVVGKTKFPLTVGAEQVFVLGDNRKYAVDSRTYGCVDKSDTKGKVIAVIRRRSL